MLYLTTPSSGTSSTEATASTNDSETACFAVIPYEEHQGDLVIAFHTPGRLVRVDHFPRIATHAQIIQAATNHLARETGVSKWRSHFLPFQPHMHGVDLHCMMLPAEGAAACVEAVLADLRGVFGQTPHAFAAIPFDRSLPQVEQRILASVRQFLLDSALADPPTDFILSLAAKGGILALSQPAAHATHDTVSTALHFPGLRQLLMNFAATTPPTTTTTTTHATA